MLLAPKYPVLHSKTNARNFDDDCALVSCFLETLNRWALLFNWKARVDVKLDRIRIIVSTFRQRSSFRIDRFYFDTRLLIMMLSILDTAKRQFLECDLLVSAFRWISSRVPQGATMPNRSRNRRIVQVGGTRPMAPIGRAISSRPDLSYARTNNQTPVGQPNRRTEKSVRIQSH